MDMILNRRKGDSQRCRDPFVRQPSREEGGYLVLARGQRREQIRRRRQPGLHDSDDRLALLARPKDADAERSAAQVEQQAAPQPVAVLVGDLDRGSPNCLDVLGRETLACIPSVRRSHE